MASRRASIVVAGLLAIVALAWIAWPKAGDVDPAGESSGHAARALADTTAPAPLAAAGREARAAVDVKSRSKPGGTHPAAGTMTGAAAALDSNGPVPEGWIEIVPVGRSSVAGMTCSAWQESRGEVIRTRDIPITADGTRFRSTDMTNGEWTFRVRTSRETEWSWTCAASSPVSLTIVFGTSAVFGRLTDQRGEPRTNRTIVLRPIRGTKGPPTLGAVDDVTTATDADGSYRFDDLPAGAYRVSVGPADADAPPGSPATAEVVVEPGASVRRDLRTDEVRFTLRIRHASGSVPLVGIVGTPTVSIDGPYVHAAEEYRCLARLGSCTIGVVSDGFHAVHFGGTIDVQFEGQEIELRLPGVAVEGIVTDETGGLWRAPATDPTARPRVALSAWGLHNEVRGFVATDEAGRFRLNVVSPGRWIVTAAACPTCDDLRDRRETQAQIDVPADRDVTGLELRLPAR